MLTKNVKELKFKDGSTWEPGTAISIIVEKEKPWVASLARVETGDLKKVRSTQLHHFFDEFVRITDENLENAIMDGSCLSLTGCDVEPDGWDDAGFPSMLLALGLM